MAIAFTRATFTKGVSRDKPIRSERITPARDLRRFDQTAARIAKTAAAMAGSLCGMNLEQLKSDLLGSWRSLAPEIRPSKNPDGTLKPFLLTREFAYQRDDRFELTVMNYAG